MNANENVNEFYSAVLKLKTIEDCQDFFAAIMR